MYVIVERNSESIGQIFTLLRLHQTFLQSGLPFIGENVNAFVNSNRSQHCDVCLTVRDDRCSVLGWITMDYNMDYQMDYLWITVITFVQSEQ